MSRKIVGVTVSTPLSPQVIAEKTKSKYHMENKEIHVTAEEKQGWNNKLDASDLNDYATEKWVEEQGYLKEHQSLDDYAKKTEIPNVPEWAMRDSKPTYTATEIGADASGSAAQALSDANVHTGQEISKHNVATDAHNDLRIFISELTERVNALADSDDTTLDQMSEIVAYIKNNRELVEQVTTEKVSVTDIIDNLTTNLSNKVLSASMGVELKKLIDAIVIPTKVSAFENDKGYLTEHQSLADYAKKSELPIVPTKVSAFQNDAGYLTQHQSLEGYATEEWVEEKGYLTEIDKDEIIAEVLATLPAAEGVEY